MRINKHGTFLPILMVSGFSMLMMASATNAQPPLCNEYSNRVSHSVGSQHNSHRQHNLYRQHNSHYRAIDPWRWGPSIGFSWNNSNNWRYGFGWGNNYYRRNYYGLYPFAYANELNTGYRSQHVKVVDTVVAVPPQQTTTSIQYASGLSHLPENAKVIQRDNGTVYEWQGVEYYFDWNTQTYKVVQADQP